MFHVHDGYRRTFRIPARSFNMLAKFCNNVTPGFGMKIKRPNEPSHATPVVFEVDTKELADVGFAMVPVKGTSETDAAFAARAPLGEIEYVEDMENETAADKVDRLGVSNVAARLDHRHALPFWINPEFGETGNVQPEEVYVPDEGEDTSQMDFSGSSPYAARADHTHVFATEGATVEDLTLYDVYRANSASSHYWGVPYTFNFVNGLLVGLTQGSAIDLFDNASASNPTITNPA